MLATHNTQMYHGYYIYAFYNNSKFDINYKMIVNYLNYYYGRLS